MDRCIGLLMDKLDAFPLNMYDESVKVPFIAYSPHRFPGGIVNNNLLSHYDFMPAILDYLELENPLDGQLTGWSFAPVLRGENLADDPRHQELRLDMRNRLSRWFERYAAPDLDGSKLTDCRGSGQLERLGAGKSGKVFAD